MKCKVTAMLAVERVVDLPISAPDGANEDVLQWPEDAKKNLMSELVAALALELNDRLSIASAINNALVAAMTVLRSQDAQLVFRVTPCIECLDLEDITWETPHKM